jgi:hypothetical protein
MDQSPLWKCRVKSNTKRGKERKILIPSFFASNSMRSFLLSSLAVSYLLSRGGVLGDSGVASISSLDAPSPSSAGPTTLFAYLFQKDLSKYNHAVQSTFSSLAGKNATLTALDLEKSLAMPQYGSFNVSAQNLPSAHMTLNEFNQTMWDQLHQPVTIDATECQSLHTLTSEMESRCDSGWFHSGQFSKVDQKVMNARAKIANARCMSGLSALNQYRWEENVLRQNISACDRYANVWSTLNVAEDWTPSQASTGSTPDTPMATLRKRSLRMLSSRSKRDLGSALAMILLISFLGLFFISFLAVVSGSMLVYESGPVYIAPEIYPVEPMVYITEVEQPMYYTAPMMVTVEEVI